MLKDQRLSFFPISFHWFSLSLKAEDKPLEMQISLWGIFILRSISLARRTQKNIFWETFEKGIKQSYFCLITKGKCNLLKIPWEKWCAHAKISRWISSSTAFSAPAQKMTRACPKFTVTEWMCLGKTLFFSWVEEICCVCQILNAQGIPVMISIIISQ